MPGEADVIQATHRVWRTFTQALTADWHRAAAATSATGSPPPGSRPPRARAHRQPPAPEDSCRISSPPAPGQAPTVSVLTPLRVLPPVRKQLAHLTIRTHVRAAEALGPRRMEGTKKASRSLHNIRPHCISPPSGHRSLLWVGHSSGWFIGSRVPGGTAVAPVHAVPRLPRPARARAPPRLDVHVCAPPMPPMRRHQPAGAVGCAARAWRATGSGFSGRGRGGA